MARTEVRGGQITDASISLTADVSGTLPTANGGTGQSSPGTSGNVLTSNGTVWTSAAPTGGGRLDAPAYIPADATHYFDPALNTYNLKSSNTRRLRRGLGKAATGQICELLAVGDSAMTGLLTTTPTADRLRAWPLMARDNLGIPVMGTGLVRILDATFAEARYVTAGTWDGSNLGYAFATSNGATATFTTNLSGDRVTVHYYDGNDGTTWNVTINGAAQTTITNNAGAGWKKITYNVAIAAGQTVVLTKLTGTAMFISGITVWKSGGGVMVHNIAQSSSRASGTGQQAWVDSSSATTLGQVYAAPTVSLTNPDCVLIGLGANDYMDVGATPATVTAALTTIRNRYPNSDAILVISQKISDTYVSDATWNAHCAAMYTLADTLDVPLIDQTARLGTWSQIVANSLNSDTLGHLKIEAQVDLGRNAAQVVGDVGDRTLDLASDSISGSLPAVNGGTGLTGVHARSVMPTTAPNLTASSANLVGGCQVRLSTAEVKVGTKVRFQVGTAKTTAAGAATWSAMVRFGTAGTTADTAVATFTSATNTGAIDQAILIIEWEILTLGAAATGKSIAMYTNTLTNVTGLGKINPLPTSSAAFASTGANPYITLTITPGAAAVMTAVGSADLLV